MTSRAGALAVGSAAVFVVLLLASLHAVGGNSDGATVVLEGQAIREGHVVLHGWSLSYDSFWTIDAPIYALAVLIVGVRTALMNVVPCLIATAVVMLSVFLAVERRRRAGAIAAGLTVLGLLALPSRALSLFFLAGPYHVGTVLLCLVGFTALRRGGFGAGFIVAAVAFAAGLLGDLQMLELGVLPALGAAGVAMWRANDRRAQLPRLLAPLLGVLLAIVARAVAVALGAFSITRANPFASGHEILTNARHLLSFGAALLGLDAGPFGPTGVPGPLLALHLVGAVVVVAATLAALAGLAARLVRPADGADGPSAWRLEDVLGLALLGDLAAFVVLPITPSDAYARYLTGALIFGSVLGGRRVGALFDQLGAPRRRAIGALGLLVFGLFGVGFALFLRGPSAARPASGLSSFLSAHRLTLGVGDYWSSSILSVESGGSVLVRPVVATPAGRLVRYDKQSSAGWYDGAAFQFYVYDAGFIWDGDDRAVAAATFGRPARTYVFGSYRVLVWPHTVTVSSSGSIGP